MGGQGSVLKQLAAFAAAAVIGAMSASVSIWVGVGALALCAGLWGVGHWMERRARPSFYVPADFHDDRTAHPEFLNHCFRLRLRSEQSLHDAFVRLETIRKQDSDGGWSRPLNGGSHPNMAWSAGEESFLPRTVHPSDELWILVTDHKTGALQCLLDITATNAANSETRDIRTKLEPGKYQLVLSLSAVELPTPVLQEVTLDWTGEPTSLSASVRSIGQ